MSKEEDFFKGHGYVDSSEVAWGVAFDGSNEGYIMIEVPKYKWFHAKWGKRFPRMMKMEGHAVTVAATSNPDMVQLVEREEEE